MNEMQLYLITFEYFDHKCYLPRIFSKDYWNEDKKIKFCQKVIDKLAEDKNIKNLNVALVYVGSNEDIWNNFLMILKVPNPKIQYLNIEDRKLSDKRFFNELNGEFYTKMLIRDVTFPVRIIDKHSGLDIDDAILPIIMVEEFIDKN